MSGIYYVAVYGGFLVTEFYDTSVGPKAKAYTVADPRLATPFPTFDQADRTAKWATHRLYPPDLRYFAILVPAVEEA